MGPCWEKGDLGSAEVLKGKSAALYCSGMLKSKAVWLTSEMERRDPSASLYQLPASKQDGSVNGAAQLASTFVVSGNLLAKHNLSNS